MPTTFVWTTKGAQKADDQGRVVFDSIVVTLGVDQAMRAIAYQGQDAIAIWAGQPLQNLDVNVGGLIQEPLGEDE